MKILRMALCLVLAMALAAGSALALGSLSRGSSGREVRFLQSRLNALGYNVGTVDGSYGGKTESGVKSFQQAYGLPATGSVDAATWTALYDNRVTLTVSGWSVEVGIAPPYDDLEMGEDDASAYISVEGVPCDLYMLISTPLNDYMDGLSAALSDAVVQNAWESGSNSRNYREVSRTDTSVNGMPAVEMVTAFDFGFDGSYTTTLYTRFIAIQVGQTDSGLPVTVVVSLLEGFDIGGSPYYTSEDLHREAETVHVVARPAAASSTNSKSFRVSTPSSQQPEPAAPAAEATKKPGSIQFRSSSGAPQPTAAPTEAPAPAPTQAPSSNKTFRVSVGTPAPKAQSSAATPAPAAPSAPAAPAASFHRSGPYETVSSSDSLSDVLKKVLRNVDPEAVTSGDMFSNEFNIAMYYGAEIMSRCSNGESIYDGLTGLLSGGIADPAVAKAQMNALESATRATTLLIAEEKLVPFGYTGGITWTADDIDAVFAALANSYDLFG